jgi:hypothetical protein
MTNSPRSDYSRPNQLWRCGQTCGGGDCGRGPSAWGRCSQSPRCSPRLSTRGYRGLFVLCVVSITCGILCIALAEPWRNRVISPGPLSPPHSRALAEVSAEQQCDSCHDAAEADPIAWMMIAAGNVRSVADGQATRCLACHQGSLDSSFARSPHNVPPASLAEITAARFPLHKGDRVASPVTATLAALSGNSALKNVGTSEVACSTCHREHHGVHLNLTQLTDQQCQTCHAEAFSSFERGHPEFRHPLPGRRSRLAFDHVAHQQRHFPTKEQAFQCNQCHADDAGRDVKRLVGFEQACAQCHTKPIEAATLDGFAVLSLPTLDVAKLAAAGAPVGDWPAAAQGDFDGTLPPAMRLLLLADPQAAAALEQLGGDFDFAEAKEADYAAIAALAWSYKRLLQALALDAPGTLQKRLAQQAGEPLSSHEAKLALRSVPPALFQAAEQRWWPRLAEELTQPEATTPLSLSTQTQIVPQVRGAPIEGSELLAENPLAATRTATQTPAADTSADVRVPGITWWNQAEQAPPSTAAPVPQSAASPRPATDRHEPMTSNESTPLVQNTNGELLAENPLRRIDSKTAPSPDLATAVPTAPVSSAPPAVAALPEPTPEPVKPEPTSAGLEPATSEPGKPEPVLPPTEAPASEAIADTPPAESTAPDPAALASAGSWYFDEATSAVRYRPQGHGDPLVALLLNVSAAATHPAAPQHGPLPGLLKETTFQSCTSCHSIDSQERRYAINWEAEYRDRSRRRFTEFSHRPHLVQPRLADCTQCHTLQEQSQVMANFETTLPKALAHDFQPLTKARCVTCHTQADAGGHCTQCHSYHVGAIRGTAH